MANTNAPKPQTEGVSDSELVDKAHAKWRSISTFTGELFSTYSTGYIHGHRAAEQRASERIARAREALGLASHNADDADYVRRVTRQALADLEASKDG
jgi:hypothetical protein